MKCSLFMAGLAATLLAALSLVGIAQNTPAGESGGSATTPVIHLAGVVPDGKPHKFETRNKQFILDGQPTLLIAGEMHFGRILPEDFELRVQQAKAMGLNTISFYLFWNLVEPQEGKFDFTGMNDVRRMLKLCQDNGMWVILRPGPYCCAEVEYGGIPYWTVKYPNVRIRTNDPTYVEWSRKYIEQVYKQVADFQVTKGGPLLMVQMENEYAMVAAGNYDYLHSLHKIFKDAGFEVPLFVCDPGSFSGRGGNPYGDDVLRGRNGLNGEGAYQQAVAAAGDFPVYAPEVYTAWFSGWGQPVATRNSSIPAIVNWTNFLLDHSASWSYYMFFGGTNWGYDTGCNEWLPLVSSYDYSAPIDEAGRTTPKYRALRELLARRTGRTLPEPPPDPDVVNLSPIRFSESEPLLATLPPKPTRSSPKLLSMEELDQDYGFILYRRQFPAGLKGKLQLKDVMDYAVTMVNGKTVGKTFVGYGPESNTIEVNENGPVTLDILVHNLGRISVITSANSQYRAKKGLGDVLLDGQALPAGEWQIYSLPLASVTTLPGGPKNQPQTGPTFYHATFNMTQPASTFLDMRNWGMGVAWVNGHNLGRFWDRGGIRSLFLSSHFLRAGSNDVVVLELHDAPKMPEISGTTHIVETKAVPFALRLDRSNLGPAPTTRQSQSQHPN